MKHTIIVASLTAGVGLSGMPALAHPGPHHGMSFGELAQHLASGWHLLTLGLAAAVIATAVLIVGQRRQARDQHAVRTRRRAR